jgi:outer membrane protein TolC
MPKEKPSSFETMIVAKSDIEVPVKFSAKMKGQADVTIMPQVSGQLMKIYVTEGQQVSKGQTLFVIDSRNAQHELESAKANLQAANANLQAAQSQANSAKLEYESNKNLYEKQIVSNYMLESSLNTYKQAQATVSQAQAAVNQMESSYLSVKTSIVDTRRNIRQVENALCRLLAITPQSIPRSRLGLYALPRRFETGVPASLLRNRPDIKLADLAMEEAFYDTQIARAAFYPSISLQGLAGWTNSAGGGVVNPGKILLNAVASLTQPIYAQGKLKANLEINQLEQQDLMNQYVQTVIDAGSEVNEALADCQAAVEKHGYYHRQVEVLKDAYKGTHELMDNGKASYLEVLTAQETLLNAQLNEAVNMYNGAQGIIALYIALGGATR